MRRTYGPKAELLEARQAVEDLLNYATSGVPSKRPLDEIFGNLTGEMHTKIRKLHKELHKPSELAKWVEDDVNTHTVNKSILVVNAQWLPDDSEMGRLCTLFQYGVHLQQRVGEAEDQATTFKRQYEELLEDCATTASVDECIQAKGRCDEAHEELQKAREFLEDTKVAARVRIKKKLSESIRRLAEDSYATEITNKEEIIDLRNDLQTINKVGYNVHEGKWCVQEIKGLEIIFSASMRSLGVGTFMDQLEEVIADAPQEWVRAKGCEYLKALRDLCLAGHEFECVNVRVWELDDPKILEIVEKTAVAARLLSQCLGTEKRIISEITEYNKPAQLVADVIKKYLNKTTTDATLSQDVADCLLKMLPPLREKGAYFAYDDVINDEYVVASNGKPLPGNHIMVASVFLTETMLALVDMVKVTLTESVWWTRAGASPNQRLPFMDKIASGVVYGGAGGFGSKNGFNSAKRIRADTNFPQLGHEPPDQDPARELAWVHGMVDYAMEHKFLPNVVKTGKRVIVETTCDPDPFVNEVLANYKTVFPDYEALHEWVSTKLYTQGGSTYEAKQHILALRGPQNASAASTYAPSTNTASTYAASTDPGSTYAASV